MDRNENQGEKFRLKTFFLEFDGISCSGCISSVKERIGQLEQSKLLKLDNTTGNSILSSNKEKNEIMKYFEAFEGCCASCQISIKKCEPITDKNYEFQSGTEDRDGLIKKQYKKALENIVAKKEVACSEYCVCKTTDIDRLTEFSEAPSFSSIFNLSDYLKKLNYLHSGMSVIDFGSGTGHDSFQIAPFITPGIVTGIDVTPEMVNYAKATAKNLKMSNVAFHQSGNLHLVKPVSHDLILVNNVFNILSEKLFFLQQAHKILKPNGTLVIADEFTIDHLPESLRKDPSFQCGGIADAQSYHYIGELCQQNGFELHQKEIVRRYEIEYNNRKYSLESGILILNKK